MNSATLKAIEARADAAVERRRAQEPPPFFEPGDPAGEPPKPEQHPWTRFVEVGAAPKPPRWIVPGFIEHGVVVFAGAHSVGKTTALLPLAMTVAGLHEESDPLAPRHWRHVVFITEHREQADRIIAGLSGHLGLDTAMVRERLHLVEAERLSPDYAVAAGAAYREQFARIVNGVEILPLVALDTMAATLRLESENDNAEASAAIAALKQGFAGLPVWLIGHIGKANLTRSDAASMTLRGASAFEADANQVLYLVKEQDDSRWLVRGKTRFEAHWPELQIESHWRTSTACNEFGEAESLTLRWAIPKPPEADRKTLAEQSREAERKADEAELRDAIRNAVQVAWQAGNPLNRDGIKAAIPRNRRDVTDCIERLLSERWLYEVCIPSKDRLHPRKSSFLVNLTTEEHEAITRDGLLPTAKLVIPDSWKKEISSVPGIDAKNGEMRPGGQQ